MAYRERHGGDRWTHWGRESGEEEVATKPRDLDMDAQKRLAVGMGRGNPRALWKEAFQSDRTGSGLREVKGA